MGTLRDQAERRSDGRRNQLRARFLQQMIPKGGIAAELGVHKGNFTRCILDLTRPTRLNLIDPWYLNAKEWNWGTGNRSTVDGLISVLANLRDELVSGRAVLHIGDDLEVLATFADEHFHWVYLDTTHQYEHTKRELDILKSKMRKGGIIAGDDWQVDPTHQHHGVCRAVREFLARENYELAYASSDDLQWAIRSVC